VNSYQQQDRGDLEAYARYLAGMDAAMRQKVALTAAHLPSRGRVADMGMGSGSGSLALAALYPRLQVVGVDVNPRMVELAGKQHHRPNLSFRVGDIAESCFSEGSLDGIVNSSVLHHVTSYNGYQYAQASRALAAQAKQLALGGTLIVRDFLAPPRGLVELRLPEALWGLWRQFSQQFRALLPAEQRGFDYQDCGLDASGWGRFQVQQRLAVEFVLRKDYRQDWDTEILEEYTYFTQTEFEEEFRRLGLRVLVSTPLYNPWILQHRFEGQFALHDLDGQRLDFPPTNYLIVGEKVGGGEGVSFYHSPQRQPSGYLSLSCYQNKETGKVYDLVCRPHPTVDVLPFCVTPQGNLEVLVRHSYPRPIPTLLQTSLDGLKPVAYGVEPLTVVQGDEPLGETVEAVLVEKAGLSREKILWIELGDTHYPSPGGIREEVIASFAEISCEEAMQDGTTCPGIRSLDAHQLLRSAQVNGLSDHRLEMHIFALMRRRKIDPGPWLGDRLAPPPQSQANQRVKPAAGWALTARRAFLPCPPQQSPGFLVVSRHQFHEQDGRGEEVRLLDLESVSPSRLSLLTVATLPMSYHQGEWWAGLDCEDLPAVQAFAGNSQHWLAPAWRLPSSVHRQNTMREWVNQRLRDEYNSTALDWAPLGGPYFPSPGLTPELVYPYAVRVDSGDFSWFRLETVIDHWELLTNGHLRCLALRAWLAHRSGEG